jgi:hypothetical protein
MESTHIIQLQEKLFVPGAYNEPYKVFPPNLVEVEQSASDASPNLQTLESIQQTQRKTLEELSKKYLDINDSYFTMQNILIGVGIIAVILLVVYALRKKNKRRYL